MSNSSITSSTSAAAEAITGITAITVNTGKQFSLGKSNLSSMKTATEVNNRLLSNLSRLVDCVQTQSEKFPQIAELMALKDNQLKFESCGD